MKLAILEQSPVMGGLPSRAAIKRTIEMAKYAEKLGYYRFWVGESHGAKAFASASPEVTASAILCQTQNLRVGVGAILVGHYSPLKVAETVRALNAIGEGRFDFGIGRSPGAHPEMISALSGFEFSPENINSKIDEIFGYLEDELTLKAVPCGEQVTQRWMMCGSVGGAAVYAGKNGLPLAYAHFVNPTECADAVKLYREHFRPSKYLEKPYIAVTLNVIVAETDEKAQYIAKPLLNFFLNDAGEFLTQTEVDLVAFNDQDADNASKAIGAHFVGSPSTVKDKLQSLVAATQCDEISLLCIVDDPADQRYTYQKIAEMAHELN